jgi:hypothetical protein
LAALAAYSALAIAVTFPLVLRLTSVLPHDLGDPLLSATILWWNAHVFPLTDRWWNGFGFFPATGVLAYSDHRLGESLLATPLQWLGCGPVTAYNITLLATFPLSATAAHWLGFTLTKRHDAAALCGLAYGFSPYRAAHIEHLELLAAFGMPAALAALHRYVDGRERKWLVILAIAFVVQALCTSYYLLFFPVFLGLWIVWFVRWPEIRLASAIAAAVLAASAILLPVLAGFSRIHQHFGFVRSYGDIVRLSADATSFVTASPMSLFWGWTSRLNGPERQLFPGLTITVLALFGAAVALRRGATPRDRIDRASLWVLASAGAFAMVALCGRLFAPWHANLGIVTLSSETPFKPLTLAAIGVAVSILMSSQVRTAYARRSLLGFYLLATAAMVLFSMGPKPSVLGHQVLYESPYAWLLRLPAYGAVRVPARFGMPAILALSVSGALAFSRFRLAAGTRRVVAPLLMAGILADGWIGQLPLPATPDFWPAEKAAGFAAVLELPLGDVFADTAAMYRVSHHGVAVVNGNSGFEPTHYVALKTALQEHDLTVLDGLGSSGPVLIALDDHTSEGHTWRTLLSADPRASHAGEAAGWSFFAVAPAPAPRICSGEALPIAAVSDRHGSVDLVTLTDHDVSTHWSTPGPQHTGDELVVDLGGVVRPCAILLSAGEFRRSYPRQLGIATSVDEVEWHGQLSRRAAGPTVRAALDNPKMPFAEFALSSTEARYISLRIEESSDRDPWVVTELAVRGVR